MRYFCLGGLNILALSLTLGLTPVPIAAQGTKGAAAARQKAWTLPRTPDGQPDLEGVWNSSTLTPFERPKKFTGKEFFTPQEAEEFAKDELNRVDGDRRATKLDPRKHHRPRQHCAQAGVDGRRPCGGAAVHPARARL